MMRGKLLLCSSRILKEINDVLAKSWHFVLKIKDDFVVFSWKGVYAGGLNACIFRIKCNSTCIFYGEVDFKWSSAFVGG